MHESPKEYKCTCVKIAQADRMTVNPPAGYTEEKCGGRKRDR